MNPGRDAVIRMQSHRNLAGGGAIEGMERGRRMQEGKKGGVLLCLFLASVEEVSLMGMFHKALPYLVDYVSRIAV